MNVIQFKVEGLPCPQGSKSAFPTPRTGKAKIVDGTSKEGRRKHKQWRATVKKAAEGYLEINPMEPLDEPVRVVLLFTMPVVASDKLRYRHHKKPDSDKLARSVLDSLVDAHMLFDDSRVYDLRSIKLCDVDHEGIGVTIKIEAHGKLEEDTRRHLKMDAADARRLARKQGEP